MKKELNSFRPLIVSLIVLAVIWLIIRILVNWPLFTDELYPSFYGSFYTVYVRAFGWIPFSVGDLIYFILILIFIWSLILGIRCFVLGQKWRGIRIFSRLIFSAAVFYAVFHLLWGFNYYKPAVSSPYAADAYSVEELKSIADQTFIETIALREEVKENKHGIFDFGRKEFFSQMPQRLLIPEEMNLIYQHIPRRTAKKYSLFSFLMRYAGVAGYYNPFTHEAQITRLIPDTSKPFSMAHEQAHQMGYATESEANFVGYLTCMQSDSKPLQYSANYKALKYMLNEIYPYDSVYVRQKLDAFSPGMQRDLEYERAYHRKYDGVADEAFSAMNDAYLKANDQQDGIESYNRFVDLLVQYKRLRSASEAAQP